LKLEAEIVFLKKLLFDFILYSLMSGKPAVLLIMEKKYKDIDKLQKLKKVAKKHGITVFTIDSELVIKRVE